MILFIIFIRSDGWFNWLSGIGAGICLWSFLELAERKKHKEGYMDGYSDGFDNGANYILETTEKNQNKDYQVSKKLVTEQIPINSENRDLEPKVVGNFEPHKQTVLIVEHNDFLSELIGQKISKAGFNAFLLPNANGDLVNKIKKVKPDIIITNILMPGRNGFEAIEILNEDQSTKSIPVIVLSNFNAPESIERAQKLGVKSSLVSANVVGNDVVKEIKKFI